MALNVLVVDDSAVMRAMVIKTLKMIGLPIGELHQAPDGAQGLALLEQHWIDLLLVDLNMPVLNGEEMITRLRANPEFRQLPVIVVSTEGSTTRIERLEQHDITFVHKPFAPETIREVIKQITGISHE